MMHIRSYLGSIGLLLASVPLLALALHQLTHLTMTITETTGTILGVELSLAQNTAGSVYSSGKTSFDEDTTELVYRLKVQFQTTNGERVTFSGDAPTMLTMGGESLPYSEGAHVRIHYYPWDPGATAQIGPVPQGLLVVTALQWVMIVGAGVPALALLWYGIQGLRRQRQAPRPFTFRF